MYSHVVTLGDEAYAVSSFDEAVDFIRDHGDETRVITLMPYTQVFEEEK